MNRERPARWALRAYPRGLRQARGEEMLSALLDLSRGGPGAYAREIASLVRSGLLQRARANAAEGPRRLLADSACSAASLWMTIVFFTTIGTRLHYRLLVGQSSWELLLLGGALVIALLGNDRWAGTLVLAFGSAEILRAGGELGGSVASLSIANGVVPLMCAAILLVAPRRRRLNARRLLWLVPVAVIAAAVHRPPGDVELVLLIMATVAGLALLPADSRLAIACAIVWSATGIAIEVLSSQQIHGLASVLVTVTAIISAVVIAACVTRIRRLQRPSAT